jgi:transcriptional regulator with XRE-family HTH domain
MSNLHKIITELCEKKGVSGYRLCKDTGIQPSILTDLKMGRQKSLSAVNAEKIANYFGVSVGYLLGNEEQKNPVTENGNGIPPERADFINYVLQMPDEKFEKLKNLLQLVETM